MRVFSNCLEMVSEVERELFEMGIQNWPSTFQDKTIGNDPDYLTKELIGYSYALTNYEDMDSIFTFYGGELREKGLKYCEVEFNDRLTRPPVNPGLSYMIRKDLWGRFLESDGKFSYTYSGRMGDQVQKVIDNILHTQGSRQNLISIYNPSIDSQRIGGKRRIPCSLVFQFLPRVISGEKTLFMTYMMRSSDFYSHFANDVYLAIKLLKYISHKTGYNPGTFIHFMSSLHAYQKDWGKRRIF